MENKNINLIREKLGKKIMIEPVVGLIKYNEVKMRRNKTIKKNLDTFLKEITKTFNEDVKIIMESESVIDTAIDIKIMDKKSNLLYMKSVFVSEAIKMFEEAGYKPEAKENEVGDIIFIIKICMGDGNV